MEEWTPVPIGSLKMEAIYSSERSVDFQRTTRRYIPEDSSLHNHRCENLKSYNFRVVYTNCRTRNGLPMAAVGDTEKQEVRQGHLMIGKSVQTILRETF
jgi:hypothetical protein